MEEDFYSTIKLKSGEEILDDIYDNDTMVQLNEISLYYSDDDRGNPWEINFGGNSGLPNDEIDVGHWNTD